jgi:hypothetical protein
MNPSILPLLTEVQERLRVERDSEREDWEIRNEMTTICEWIDSLIEHLHAREKIAV